MPPAPPHYRRWALLSLLACVALTTTALGCWQVQRLGWKKALIARVEARVHAEPIAPPEAAWTALSRERHEYLRVRVSGRLQHALEIPVYVSTVRGRIEHVLVTIYATPRQLPYPIRSGPGCSFFPLSLSLSVFPSRTSRLALSRTQSPPRYDTMFSVSRCDSLRYP